MARYAGGGKNTVEGCRSIDVLEWHRRGYLQTPLWFSWTWTRDGERVASINVENQRRSVTLKYRSRSYGEDWSDVEQRVAIEWTPCRFGGERPWFMCSVAANGVYCGRRDARAADYAASIAEEPEGSNYNIVRSALLEAPNDLQRSLRRLRAAARTRLGMLRVTGRRGGGDGPPWSSGEGFASETFDCELKR